MAPDHRANGETKPSEQRGGTTPDTGELESDVLGRTTGSSEPATDGGVDLDAGDEADATTDGGPEREGGGEPDLRDAGLASTDSDA